MRACGVDNVRTVNPNDLKEMKEAFDWALGLEESSVIITRWPCALKKFTDVDKKEFAGVFTEKCEIDHDKCIGCRMCIKTGCPAISFNKETKKSTINKDQCVGCGVCVQVCPKQAIGKAGK